MPDAHVKRLMDAVQAFRNLPMLGRMLKLRGTPEYNEMCEAWKEISDSTPADCQTVKCLQGRQ